VLFVSHNMGAVRSLCAKGIFLEEGHIAFSGDVNECIQRYFQAIGALAGAEDTDVGPTGRAGFGRVSLLDASGNSVEQSRGFAAGTVLRVPEGTSGFYLFFILEDMQGRIVFHLQEASPDLGLEQVEPGDYVIRLSLPPLWLVPGLYTLHFKTVLWGGSGSKYVSDKFPVDVGGISSSSNSTHCFLHPGARWNVQCATAEAAPIA
jgi:lipopolysaccharide transport system ATP-binding protein